MKNDAVPVRRCLPLALIALAVSPVARGDEPPVERLAEYSLEQLSDVEVTSVSKSTEMLRGAPASIYVITHDEIVRSGVTSIVEALRLAPNLQITQYNATYFVAGARGFAGAQEAQNFSNKLLILIDGRSVYSPLYSGVYLDVQDVVIDDIDRIEVISGPGATLWGANAMNGVINIITRPAYLTDTSLASIGYGDHEKTVSARLGVRASEATSLRIYGKAFTQDATELVDGTSAKNEWHKAQFGFRTDWTGANDMVTTSGDVYRGNQEQVGPDSTLVEGANVLARWQRKTGSSSDWQVQAYYDHTHREAPADGAAFRLDTFDVELQRRMRSGPHRVIWGGGLRLNAYDITSSASLLWSPNARTLKLGDLFVQDTIALAEAVDLTVGLKAEHDSFSGWNLLPDVRLAWSATETTALWLAVSRAIRSPTPFDVDVQEKFGDIVYLTGKKDFQPEQVDAFEIGIRSQPGASFSVSASVFFDRYDNLRSIEPAAATAPLPFHWDNLIQGDTYGFEAWLKWQVTDWWRLAPGVRLLQKNLEFAPGASKLLGLWQTGNDPTSQGLLTSSMNLGPSFNLDATWRYVGALPHPALDAYQELNVSVGWHADRHLDVSLSGFDLLHDRHLEYPYPSGQYIPRSLLAQARWRF